MADENYNISEIFRSIQGEGNFSGVNSLFVRFHYCNLACAWCDTKYTWHKHSGTFRELFGEEIRTTIAGNPALHVIFTGGEPTLYRLDKLVVPGKKFHVETNGTIIPTEALRLEMQDERITRGAMDEEVISTFNWVVSPKLSNSFQEINEEAIRYWAQKKWAVFKFIAKRESDLEEINSFVILHNIRQEKVFIGLEGKTWESQMRPEMVDAIVRLGYNFSPRLHVMLWGNLRKK